MSALGWTVLGSGTAIPDPDRGPAGFLVHRGQRAWLVDGGSGTLQRCARAGVDPRELAGGIYSHRHPDHCADLVPLLFAQRGGPPPRPRPYPIWAGTGFRAFFDSLDAVYGKWVRPPGGVVIEEIGLDGPHEVELEPGLMMRTEPANHSWGALHLRFEADGRAVVFSGDTGPSDGLVRLATGADLLVCECAGSDVHPIDGHLWPAAVAELVEAARPREVWLTHFYPQVDEAQALATVGRTGVAVRRAADGDRWG